ncbi:MAG TPA: hypothetical protein VF765_27465 [Polyangiaceae bacterium]
MPKKSLVALAFASVSLLVAAAPDARADGVGDTALPTAAPPRDAKTEVPIVAYTYAATGAPAGTYGAYLYGTGLGASKQNATGGGGVTAWGAPIDRLTLVADAPRDVYLLGHFAPSFAAIVRLLGRANEGWSLGALAKYKVEGFGTDPGGDLESELEGGLLLSYGERRGFHFDLNAITGFGLTEEGEVDTEGRLRLGYDVASMVRVGIDGQGRYRLAGSKALPNGALWDFAAGPQIVVGTGHFFGALTGGPATMGITSSGVVGWTLVASLGGAI